MQREREGMSNMRPPLEVGNMNWLTGIRDLCRRSPGRVDYATVHGGPINAVWSEEQHGAI